MAARPIEPTADWRTPASGPIRLGNLRMVSPPAKRVTIREVADAAGVSPAAVSYALRGIQVSEETQERVRKVADELGYEANPIPRALASGRTGMVGILGPSLEDLWQQRLVAEAGRVLLAHDRDALILGARGRPGPPARAGHPAARPTGGRADPLAGGSFGRLLVRARGVARGRLDR